MTPTLSLLVVSGLVAGTVFLRRASLGQLLVSSNRLNWLSVRELVVWCLVLAGLVWVFNRLLWADWPESLSGLVLLVIVSLLAGFITVSVLNISSRIHIPPTPLKISERRGNNGIIRMRKNGRAKGVLPEGVKMVWDDKHGTWIIPEPLPKGEKDALAS